MNILQRRISIDKMDTTKIMKYSKCNISFQCDQGSNANNNELLAEMLTV